MILRLIFFFGLLEGSIVFLAYFVQSLLEAPDRLLHPMFLGALLGIFWLLFVLIGGT